MTFPRLLKVTSSNTIQRILQDNVNSISRLYQSYFKTFFRQVEDSVEIILMMRLSSNIFQVK